MPVLRGARNTTGPAALSIESGSAGTGKTIVAMHRARYLARQNERVLLMSYVTTLCENIERNLQMLCTSSEREAITVSTVHKQALAVVRQVEPRVRLASDAPRQRTKACAKSDLLSALSGRMRSCQRTVIARLRPGIRASASGSRQSEEIDVRRCRIVGKGWRPKRSELEHHPRLAAGAGKTGRGLGFIRLKG